MAYVYDSSFYWLVFGISIGTSVIALIISLQSTGEDSDIMQNFMKNYSTWKYVKRDLSTYVSALLLWCKLKQERTLGIVSKLAFASRVGAVAHHCVLRVIPFGWVYRENCLRQLSEKILEQVDAKLYGIGKLS